MNKATVVEMIDKHSSLVAAAKEAAQAVEQNAVAIKGYMTEKGLKVLAGKTGHASFVEGRNQSELDVTALRKKVGDAEFMKVASVTQTAAIAAFGKSLVEPFVKVVGKTADMFKIS